MQGHWQRRIFGDKRDPRQELADILGTSVPSGGDVQPEALEWARSQVDADAMTEVEAIKALRDAEPRLGLKSATYLAQRVFAAR